MIFQWQIAVYSINRDGIQPLQYNVQQLFRLLMNWPVVLVLNHFFRWGDFKFHCNGQVASFWLTEFGLVDQVDFWKS